MTVAQRLVQEFNDLPGRPLKRKAVETLLRRVERAKSPGLLEVEKKLKYVLSQVKGGSFRLEIGAPVVLPESAGKKGAAAGKRSAPAPALSGVMTAGQIRSMKFEEVQLDGRWKQAFTRLFCDTQIGVYGMPGHGKTVSMLEFAKYLAIDKNLRVLYLANEEMGRSTLTEKLNEFDIPSHPNLGFQSSLEEVAKHNLTPGDFDAIFFDSVQTMKLDLNAYQAMRKKYPGRIYVPIIQTTKSGEFKGGKEWEHEVDIFGQFLNRQFVADKNRLDGNFSEKANELTMSHRVQDAKKKIDIRQRVKADLAQSGVAPGEGTLTIRP